MKSKKATKRALLTSAMSLVLCFAMLLGSTYAWFTDEAKTGVNTIQSGTLDVELQDANGNDLEGQPFKFKDINDETDILWEPGVTFVTDGFKIVNEGNLALKYKMIVNGVTGGNAKLLDVIDFYVTTTNPDTYNSGSEFYNNDTAKVKLEDFANKYNYLAPKGTSSLEIKGETVSDKTATYYLVGHMDENANNDYQNESITGVGITVYATQVESEVDSFDNKYDDGAYILPTVYNAAELASALEQGKSVQLGNDIELTETLTIPEGVTVTLDLNGKTINAGWADQNAGKHIYAIDNKGNWTITGNGVINARGIYNYGQLTLENGTINAIDGNGGYGVISYQGATFTMNGGTIATTLEDDNLVNEGGYDATTVRVEAGATFTMNGGEINNICDFTFAIDNHGTTTVENGEISSVHTTVANYGTMTINGGEFTCSGVEGKTAHAVWAAGGTTTINGGTFNGKDNYNGFNVDASAGATVNITGGNFLPVHSGSLYGEGTIAVSGGTFFDDPSARVATGYQAVANGDGTYTVKFSQESVDSLIENAQSGDIVEIPAGTYTFPASSLKEGVTLDCAEGTVFTGNSKLNINGATVVGATFSNPTGTAVDQTINGTFKNCVFEGSNGLRWCYAGETVVFENCVFSGDVYGVHFDGGANEAIFRNCTFSGFNAMGGAITKLTMEGCTFVANGKSNYNGINLWGSTEMTNCKFVFDGSVDYEWVDACGDNKTYTFTNCVVTDGTTEKGIETVVGNYGAGNTIMIDGKQV